MFSYCIVKFLDPRLGSMYVFQDEVDFLCALQINIHIHTHNLSVKSVITYSIGQHNGSKLCVEINRVGEER